MEVKKMSQLILISMTLITSCMQILKGIYGTLLMKEVLGKKKNLELKISILTDAKHSKKKAILVRFLGVLIRHI